MGRMENYDLIEGMKVPTEWIVIQNQDRKTQRKGKEAYCIIRYLRPKFTTGLNGANEKRMRGDCLIRCLKIRFIERASFV